jgi:hypothetical protein
MLLMSLWFGRLATTEAGTVSLLSGGFTIGLACFGGALLVGLVDADRVPDEEMGTPATLLFAVLIIGGVMIFVGLVII